MRLSSALTPRHAGRMGDSSFRGAPTSARQPHITALSLLVLATGLPHIMSIVQVRKARLRKACKLVQGHMAGR